MKQAAFNGGERSVENNGSALAGPQSVTVLLRRRADETITSAKQAQTRDALSLLARAQINQSTLEITIALPNETTLTFRTSLTLKKRGVEWRMVIGCDGQVASSGEPDRQLLRTLARAFRWQDDLMADDRLTVRELARRDRTDERFIAKHLPLASLSPTIIRAILDGTQPAELTSGQLLRLKDLALTREDRKRALGFAK